MRASFSPRCVLPLTKLFSHPPFRPPGKDRPMSRSAAPGLFVAILSAIAIVSLVGAPPADSACCYFAAKDKDVQQPGQKAFITWDPDKKTETFTVQPKFEGNAKDFGMVIPTPGKPKLDEMPRDFFKEMAVYTILKQREYPQSHLHFAGAGFGLAGFGGGLGGLGGGGFGGGAGFGGGFMPRPPAVKVLETGVVGALDYKILEAKRADDLYDWLKDHQYKFGGDEATLDHYIKKGWFFTVMKIDTKQMKVDKDGKFLGELTPTRFEFTSDKLVYPLKITQISVKDKTEALFYVQAPHKVDLPGDFTYQYSWVSMLQNAQGWYQKGIAGKGSRGKTSDLPGKGGAWLAAIKDEIPKLLERAKELEYDVGSGQQPEPNKAGRTPTMLEWAKRLKAKDIALLKGRAAYSDKVPDVDEGFTAKDMEDEKKAAAARKVIDGRFEKYNTERPDGYTVRDAPAPEVKQLKLLLGHLREGQFLTKFRKTFTKEEMDDDLILVPAAIGKAKDESEYEEILPTSPP
jgi:hypothetical protein